MSALSWLWWVVAIIAAFLAYQVIDLPAAVHRTTHTTTENR